MKGSDPGGRLSRGRHVVHWRDFNMCASPRGVGRKAGGHRPDTETEQSRLPGLALLKPQVQAGQGSVGQREGTSSWQLLEAQPLQPEQRPTQFCTRSAQNLLCGLVGGPR